jgi:hypothetical protein
MHTSKIVEVDGVFIGAAVLLPDAQGWRFIAADHRADAADGRTAPTLHDTQQLAKRAFFTSRSRALAPVAAVPATTSSGPLPMPPAEGSPAHV